MFSRVVRCAACGTDGREPGADNPVYRAEVNGAAGQWCARCLGRKATERLPCRVRVSDSVRVGDGAAKTKKAKTKRNP